MCQPCAAKKNQLIAADNMLVFNHGNYSTAIVNNVQVPNGGLYHMLDMTYNNIVVLIHDNVLLGPDVEQTRVNVSTTSNNIMIYRDEQCSGIVISPIMLHSCHVADFSINNLHLGITVTQYFVLVQETNGLDYTTDISQTDGVHFRSSDRHMIDSWITKMLLLHYHQTHLLCCFIRAQLTRSLLYKHDYQCYLAYIDHCLYHATHDQPIMHFTIQTLHVSARVMKWILDTTISSAIQLGAHILNDHEFTCSVTDNTFKN